MSTEQPETPPQTEVTTPMTTSESPATAGREIRLWAPRAKRVDIHVGAPGADAAVRPMRASEDGWWTWRQALGAGALDHAFGVYGGEPRPDPRPAR